MTVRESSYNTSRRIHHGARPASAKLRTVINTDPTVKTNAETDPATVAAQPRHTRILLVLTILVALMFLATIQRMRSLQLRPTTTQTLAPGLTLTKTIVNTPGGEIPEYIVRAQKKSGWKFRLLPSDVSVLKLQPVSQIAANYNARHKTVQNAFPAPVAVNGGYFAYAGAAVGAVKIDNEWIRLPWKNRTAIGWDNNGKIEIGNLRAQAWLRLSGQKATLSRIRLDNLNGRPSSQTVTPITHRFASQYALQKGEFAVQLRNMRVAGMVSSGKVLLSADPSAVTLVVGARVDTEVRSALQTLTPGDSADFQIETTPAAWNDFPTILGAGPRLIENGTIKVTHIEEEFRPDVLARGPRTTLGIDREGNLIILIIEAWHDKIRGMTLDAVAAELQRAGAVEGINLDGGSSTTLVVNNNPVTHLSDLVIDSKIIEPASERREVGVANAVILTR